MIHEASGWMIGRAIRIGAQAMAAARVETSVSGLENIPGGGPVLLLARHYHYLFDGVVLLVSVPRPIHIMVAVDWVKNRYARRLLTLAASMVRWPSVVRSDAPRAGVDQGRYHRTVLRESVELLAEGRLLVVFPEGYPNIDRHYTPKTRPEEMLPFKAGFVAIAVAAEKRLGARVPIVPAGFRYTKARHWRAELHIGEAVYVEDWESRWSLIERMERRIAELSGLSATRPQPKGGSTPRESSPADASAPQSSAPIHRV
jgi:putative membrane protein